MIKLFVWSVFVFWGGWKRRERDACALGLGGRERRAID